MRVVVGFIVNCFVSFLIFCVLDFHSLKKRRYQKLKTLNAELDVILKIAELENKESQLSDRIRRCLKRVCEEMEEIIADERNKNV